MWKNGCQESHHRLLHQRDRRVEPSEKGTRDQTEPKRVDSDQTEHSSGGCTLSEDETDSVTEGKEPPGYTTLNIHEIWLRLFRGDYSLYIRAKMTSFVNSHD